MQCLVIDCDGSSEEVDLTEHLKTEQNPYFIAQKLIECDVVQMVKTPFKDVMMFVDEMGSYTQPQNEFASLRLYPGIIYGKVVIFKMELVYTTDGPDYEIRDLPTSQCNKLAMTNN